MFKDVMEIFLFLLQIDYYDNDNFLVFDEW
jgi:hypothetical protein